ncbi:MAG: glycosyltransferase [Cyanobacteria bacterium J06648_16]
MLASILINNYNYETYLEAAITSALNQTYDIIEVIVVDDGSVDGSRQIIEKFGDRIVPVLKANGGQASAINAGFQACRGEYVFLLDADDCFKPSKVAQIIEIFEKHADAGWCFHELEETDADGQTIHRRRHQVTEFEIVNLRPVLTSGQNFQHWFPATSGLCFRQEILSQILPMPEVFHVSADALIRLMAIYLAPGVLAPENLATHRQHGKNLYEFKPNIHIERLKIGIKTAYYLHRLIPEARPFANKEFIFNVGKLMEYSEAMAVFKNPEFRLYIKQENDLLFLTKLISYIIKGNAKKLINQ